LLKACMVVAVDESVSYAFIKQLIEKANAIKMGNGLDEGIFLCPVIRESHKQRTLQYIETGEQAGTTLVRDDRNDKSAQEGGYYVGQTIFDGVTSEMEIWQDEDFAPVLSVARVKNLEGTIKLSNRAYFANGTCIFTT